MFWHFQKEMLLDQQLPPTNHDRLAATKQLTPTHMASSSPAHMPPPSSNSNAINNMDCISSPADHQQQPLPAGSTAAPTNAAAAATANASPAPQIIYRSYFEREDDDPSLDFRFVDDLNQFSDTSNNLQTNSANSDQNSYENAKK